MPPAAAQQVVALFGFCLLSCAMTFVFTPSPGATLEFYRFYLSNLDGDTFLSGLFLASFVVGVATAPAKLRPVVLGLGLAWEIAHGCRVAVPHSVYVVKVTGLRAGLVGLLACLGRMGRAEERRDAGLALLHCLSLPLLYLAGTFFLRSAGSREGFTFDLFYYAADRTLGPPLCFAVRDWTTRSELFYTLGYLGYFALSHGMGLAGGVWFLRPLGVNPNLCFIGAGLLCGNLGYLAYPGVGPEIVFQDAYPGRPPAILQPALYPVPGGYPRNTMPSLHLFWAYAIWFSLIPQPLAVERTARAYLLAMPGLAFLGSHFLVDYFPTLGVAPAWMMFLSRLGAPRAWPRPVTVLAGWAAVLGIGYCPLLVHGSPVYLAWPWTLQFYTLALLASSGLASWRLREFLRAC